MTSSFTFNNFNIDSLEKYQITHKNIAKKTSIVSVWEAVLSSFSLFLAQAYWAIRIVQAIENHVQSETIKKIIGKLADMEATASLLIFHIQ